MIIGDGELRSELEYLAGLLGVLSRIRFIGNVKDTAKYLQASDVFVLASDRENQSNALIEAMACGLPVIATAVGGNKEIIQHDVNGILVPNSSAYDLSQAVERILSNDKMCARLGANARQSVIAHYSIDCVIEQYLSLYNLPKIEIRAAVLFGGEN
jgi:glycosyltransferase involved in cell wall biosynthesis